MDVNERNFIPRDLHGTRITINDLPNPNIQRWVASRKAIVVNAVRGGLIPLETILKRYNMSRREFRLWEEGLDEDGANGLMLTKAQSRKRRKQK